MRTLIQVLGTIALFAMFIIGMALLLGEDDPQNPTTLSQFLLIKAGAAVTLYVDYKLYCWLDKRGLIFNDNL